MKFYTAILMGILANEEIQVTFPNLHVDITALVDLKSCQALEEIMAITADASLKDEEALSQIKIILHTLAAAGWRSQPSDPTV